MSERSTDHMSGSQFHTLDKRLAVVETRLDDQDRELRTIHNSIDDIHRGIQKNTNLLQDHIKSESQDRLQIVSRINVNLITLIISILGALGLFLLNRVAG